MSASYLSLVSTSHDTPIKTVQSSHLFRTMDLARDNSQAVEKDVKGHLYSADTQSFIKRIFPVPSTTVNRVFHELRQSGFYKDGRWQGLPESNKELEDKHYIPLTRIANAIRDAVSKATPNNDLSHPPFNPPTPSGSNLSNDASGQEVNEETINGIWVDRHSKAPKSKTRDSAKIRPDLIFVRIPEEMEHLDDQILASERPTLSDLPPSDQGGSTEATSKAKAKPQLSPKEKLLQMHHVWWQHIHTVIELKRKDTSVTEAFRQILVYMRRMLCEQVDRRFVLGLLLCFDRLSVCLCDRSGVLFTDISFSIHQHPLDLIRVIASFSILKPHELGWDPGMKVYLPEDGRIVPSYVLSPEDLSKSPYRTHWLIDLPLKNGSVEKVLTARGISLAWAEVMSGRATVVWEVVKYCELPRPKNVYVLKRYWRPADLLEDVMPKTSASLGPSIALPPREGEATDKVTLERLLPEEKFYQLLDVVEERLDYSGDITIGGEVDSTCEFIRQGLAVNIASWDQIDAKREQTGAKRQRRDPEERRESDDDAEHYLPINTTARPHSVKQPSNLGGFIPRVHTQLLMKDPGPSVKHFCCLLELVSVTEDCIHDHKKFNAKGVLHRDISHGNMIIIPGKDGWAKPGIGRLIDLDRAKLSRKKKKTTLVNFSIPDQNVSSVLGNLPRNLRDRVGMDVVKAAVAVTGEDNLAHASLYIALAIKTRENYFGLKLADGAKYSCADLGWDKEDIDISDFSDRLAQLSFRSGTLPFMSYEVLSNVIHNSYWAYRGNDVSVPSFFHDSVHDLDSFGWVVINICLTRKGPGMNMFRDELRPDNSTPGAADLRDLVYKLFDADAATIQQEREKLLTTPGKMDTDIVPFFHSYFKPLESMVLRWWHTLILAYQYRAFEYFHIHDFVIDILERTKMEYVNDAAFNGTDESDAYKKEINRRITHYGRALTMFSQSIEEPGQGSSVSTPEKSIRSTSSPGPIPDSPTNSARQNSRKKPRV